MFEPGDRVVVVKVRPFLQHKIGDTATVVKYVYRKNDAMIEVEWDDPSDGRRSNVYADQFVQIMGAPMPAAKVEDTRDYLSIITGEKNV